MGGERIVRQSIFFDQHARIPFSIIGIFIILGSSFTTVYISRLELEKSLEISRFLGTKEIQKMLFSFEADVANALNSAGRKALKEIGKNPVIKSSIGNAETVNYNRIKEIIKDELNVYLISRYLDNMFSNGNYVINVVLQSETPITSKEDITLETISMRLERHSLAFIGPSGTRDHLTYLVASVNLSIEICFLRDTSGAPLTTRDIVVTSLLTSRYPLLRELMNEYHETINGTFSPLWAFTTALSNVYSLTRGFKHFRCGKPLNIMDNRHLSLMVNSGLLLEQSLVFGSVDPFGLVELARKTKSVLKQSPSDALCIFNNQMKGDGYRVSSENLTKGSANVDAGSSITEPIDLFLPLNCSEIAEHVLYNISSVNVQFENIDGESFEQLIMFDENFSKTLDEIVQHWANQSFFLKAIVKNLIVNTTTQQMVQTIITEMYRDSMETQVVNRTILHEQGGDPGLGWADGGESIWCCSSFVPVSKKLVKPPKGSVVPGCALYEEVYTVSYERTHYWWRIENHIINGTMVQLIVWNNMTDYLTESVILQTILLQYALYQASYDDIVDILYVNNTLADQNLEDTLDRYLNLYQDSQQDKQELITTRDNIDVPSCYAVVEGIFSEWVFEEAWSALEEIFMMIRTITLSPDINTKRFPDPLVFIEKAKENILTQFDSHLFAYLNYSAYHTGSGFQSVGKKAVYYARKWYVDIVKNMTKTVFCLISEQINQSIHAAIPSNADFTTQNLTKTIEDVSDTIHNQFTIPFGYPMSLTRYQHGVSLWNETLRLAVDHFPNFLDPFEKTSWGDEEIWTLKIRNRCVFGPTGLPILPPTPFTPWLLTMNCWVIDVEGEFAQLKIIDTSDETIFHPLFGHEPQTYIRELKVITRSNTTLGENTRLSFGFTTVAFSLVPPWGMMVGDIQVNWFDDHTAGFDEEDD